MGAGQGTPESRDYSALNGTLEGRVLRRAIEDLFSGAQSERISALLYFTENNHQGFCETAGFDAEDILDRVLEAVSHTGIRREKLARQIVRYLVGN